MIALTGAAEVMEDPPPEEVPWAPRMDDIRQAQLAEVDALERVVGALASKQQSSIAKLGKQVEMMMAWKSEVADMSRKAAAKRKAENFARRANTSANTANLTGASGENLDAGVAREDETIAVGAPEQSDVDRSALVEHDIEEWHNNRSDEAHEQGSEILDIDSSDEKESNKTELEREVRHRQAANDDDNSSLPCSAEDAARGPSHGETYTTSTESPHRQNSDESSAGGGEFPSRQKRGSSSGSHWDPSNLTAVAGPEDEGFEEIEQDPRLERNAGTPVAKAGGGTAGDDDRPKGASTIAGKVSSAGAHSEGRRGQRPQKARKRAGTKPRVSNIKEPTLADAPNEITRRDVELSKKGERKDRHGSSASSHYKDHHSHHKDNKKRESSGGVQGMFDGAMGGNPVLMFTSMAMQLQSQETELENLQHQLMSLEAGWDGQRQARRVGQEDVNKSHHNDPHSRDHQAKAALDSDEYAHPKQQHSGPQPVAQSMSLERPSEESSQMGRDLGKLQREIIAVRDRVEDQEKRTEISLEELEALIAAKDEEYNRRFLKQAQQNADAINRLLARLDSNAVDEKSKVVHKALVELKLELRSLLSSLEAISSNERGRGCWRRRLEIPLRLPKISPWTALRQWWVKSYIGEKEGRKGGEEREHFSDRATDLGTTLFAFVKAQVLQARRAEDGGNTKHHRRTSSAEAATALVTANLAGGGGITEGATAEEGGGENGGSEGVESSTSGASPQAWVKLNCLTYTRHGTSEKMPFPAGMVVLLKALSNVLNHCVGTGDLAVGTCVCFDLTEAPNHFTTPRLSLFKTWVRTTLTRNAPHKSPGCPPRKLKRHNDRIAKIKIRLSVTLEDLTVYVAQRADKERESVIRQLSAPVDSVKGKLGEMENTLAGFQRTMHLVLSEVDADRERSQAIADLGTTVETMQGLFSRLSKELSSKAGASEIEKALEDMTLKINKSANEQTKLQRLGRVLGKDQNSSVAMKRLQIELEQARATAILSMVPSDKDVLIGSKCLSCNRPLGGFGTPQVPKGLDEWYTGAGGLGGRNDRVVEVGGENGGSGHGEQGRGGGRGGDGSSVNGIGTSRTPGRTQPVMTPGKIAPRGSATASSASGEPGTVPPKGPQGPLLFERTGTTDDVGGSGGPGLKGRLLRGGGGGSGSVSADGNVSVSKYPRLVPLTAPKSAPTVEKLYSTNGRGATSSTGRRPS
ncbi:hypothetical protein Esi_0044_0093 [Ectocarpus siliculosus]|uniref:Uncharacterized protein n=1 Tax=Ectocarpus siliculosus TaxID=2880 RepID=D8LNE5_ECTSI|nr:hypothetical protein Esi_0044_0093 [Ectocarpus siliculosus]|eukprot:CBN77302.1 hypothetical protein Esi_0044_0093 [Ectocarpus siliculosus]